MSKIRTGTEEITRVEEVYTHDDVDQVKVTPLSVDWRYEESEYGDGSIDKEFETIATDPDGERVILTQDEEDSLYSKLESEGAFE